MNAVNSTPGRVHFRSMLSVAHAVPGAKVIYIGVSIRTKRHRFQVNKSDGKANNATRLKFSKRFLGVAWRDHKDPALSVYFKPAQPQTVTFIHWMESDLKWQQKSSSCDLTNYI